MCPKKFTALILCLVMLFTVLPANLTFAQEDQTRRTVYIHAQGENPADSTDSSTVYMGDTADIYLAVDDPNKGLYENGEHLEPQYDMNGYTVKFYFDPEYFEFAAKGPVYIDYTVPDANFTASDSGSETVDGDEIENLPTTVGYYIFASEEGNETINGKNYSFASITVLFNGEYLPQKNSSQLWYNLCKLPLRPLKIGSTEVFIDTSGKENSSLELFAKNNSDELNEQTFDFNVLNGGYHNIVIKDKSRPLPPTPAPPAGSYTEKQTVSLSAESGCQIYYALNGSADFVSYTAPIEVEVSTTISCYAERTSDKSISDTVSYKYEILPKSPLLFDEDKNLIPNIYNEYSAYTVYVSDKEIFGGIDDTNEIYYTFSDLPAENITESQDPYTGWVKLNKVSQSIEITKQCTLRLVTNKLGQLSDVSWYYLGVKPAEVTASHISGEYDKKIDITLSCATGGAKIFYTIDGSDPVSEGTEYAGPITIAKDTTLRAVAYYDGQYSDVSSFYYLFKFYDNYGVDAFYPSGVYEGSVLVTLTANDPENTVKYSTDGGNTWLDYTETLNIDKDTDLFAKAVDQNGNEGDIYNFTYKIKPMEPAFAPESTQFTNDDKITVYCAESTNENTDRFELYYTTDGTDPITSPTRLKAADDSDSVIIDITGYTVISAVVLKDKTTYSNVVTHSYDIVSVRPVNPMTTLKPGSYTRKIGDEIGFSTQFMPVAADIEIYYTISYDGSFVSDPIPNTENTFKYNGEDIPVKGRTIIKAVAVNEYGTKSDVGIFEYVISPQAPIAAPSASISGEKLPVVLVSALLGSTVKYEINGFSNEFLCEDSVFYIDSATGNAYKDAECTQSLGTLNSGSILSPAELSISAELDGVESYINRYTYSLSDDENTLAAPYADKETGEYEEIKIDSENNLLSIKLYSLNSGDNIQYKKDNELSWTDYDGSEIKIKNDTVLQLRSEKGGRYSEIVSYVYNFVPLAPIITLPSGRYEKDPVPTTKIELDSRAPEDVFYTIWYRANGDTKDFRYNGQEREITHTMSFKAYVLNEDTGRVSENTIHYYIIEGTYTERGSVYVADPYDEERISADILNQGEYQDGIKLVSDNKNAKIHYYYSYVKTDGTSAKTNELIYDNAAPVMVNSSMDSITITAWLVGENGRIEGSDMTHTIDFIHLSVPETSLGTEKIEFDKGTKYTLVNEYEDDKSIILYYTLDGSDPADENNADRKAYDGEEFTLDDAITIKAVYFSACGKCSECKDDNISSCLNGVFGKTGEYRYTVPTIHNVGGGGGNSGGGGSGSSSGVYTQVVDNSRKYTKDIFGNEHTTHIGYINGYPDGSVKPDGQITREEMAAILYRIKNKEYDKPFTTTGNVFPDVSESRWSVTEIEYMADDGVIYGYPDGEFKPGQNLTRAEFAALIRRFTNIKASGKENVFPDLSDMHWAYEDIMALYEAGLLNGYEDGTIRAENQITRAEVMTVINRLLGRNPSESYVKSLDYNPFNDLKKDQWYYVIVLEATVTHDYLLDSNEEFEIKWEDAK